MKGTQSAHDFIVSSQEEMVTQLQHKDVATGNMITSCIKAMSITWVRTTHISGR